MVKKGICLNFGECKIADRNKNVKKPVPVEISITEDFVCPECGSDLQELPPPKKPPIGLFAAIGAVVVALGVGAYFLFLKPAPEISVYITPARTTIQVDETKKLEVKTDPEKYAAKMKWIWESDNDYVATVNQKGIVEGFYHGNATITVRAEKDGNLTATARIEVLPAEEREVSDNEETTDSKETPKPTEVDKPKEDPKPKEDDKPKQETVSVTRVTITNCQTSLNVGGSFTLVANIEPSNATNKKIEWSSNNPSIISVDSNGKVTAVSKGSGRASATITARSAANPQVETQCSIKVN